MPVFRHEAEDRRSRRLVLEEGVEAFHGERVARQLRRDIDPERACLVTGRRPGP